jgi:hypothetical protein
MARRRKEPEAGDQWLDRLVDEMYQRMERGESPSLSHLLEELLHRLMERERRRFLGSSPRLSVKAVWVRPRWQLEPPRMLCVRLMCAAPNGRGLSYLGGTSALGWFGPGLCLLAA